METSEPGEIIKKLDDIIEHRNYIGVMTILTKLIKSFRQHRQALIREKEEKLLGGKNFNQLSKDEQQRVAKENA